MRGKSGIYKWVNLVNKKIYVGSSIYLSDRKYSHLICLKKNCHQNIHLQSAFNKYGEQNFKFEIIEIVEILENETHLEFKHRLVK